VLVSKVKAGFLHRTYRTVVAAKADGKGDGVRGAGTWGLEGCLDESFGVAELRDELATAKGGCLAFSISVLRDFEAVRFSPGWGGEKGRIILVISNAGILVANYLLT